MAVISVKDVVVGERTGSSVGNTFDIVVTLDAPATQAVAVNYITANGTAAGGLDLTGVSGTLNFAIGETTKTVAITLANDAIAENLEHFRFNLSAPVNATLGQASAMVSIVDNDTVAVLPGLFVRDTVVDEKAGTATFVVMMGGPAGQASGSTVTVGYAVGGGNATAGLDYTGASDPLTGTLTFAPGETVKTVTVSIIDDALAEGQERFNLTLSSPVNATIVDGLGVAVIGASSETGIVGPSISVADRVVGEGDGYIDMVVALSAPSTQAVAVNYITANGTAAGGLDLTGVSGTLNFAIGETTKTVRIEMSEVQGVEGLEHFRFNLSAPVNATLGQASAMVSIVDNDTVAVLPGLFVRDTVVDEKAGTATFVVMMGGPAGQASGSTVTVGYAVGGGNATAGLDYTGASDPLTGTLTFAPGETVKTVTVSIIDDALAEGQERFNLTLSSPVNATIVDGLSVAVIGASSETGIVGPSISVADRVVGEGDGYIDMVVALSAPSTQAVAVNYITANGTAAGGLDLTGVSGTLNFAIGETTKTVRIEMSEVQGVEGLEHFRFNLSAPVNATLGQASAMVSIVDNDTVAVLPGLFVRDTVVDEKAGTATFVVMMGGPAGQASGSTVTVGYAVGGGTATSGLDYTGTSDPLTGTLTFAPGETVKTVTVSIIDDALAEGQERFNLTLSSPVNATIVDGLGVAVIGASSETGIVGPSISVADRVVGEGDGYIDMVVSLSAPSTQAVAVNYITANGTAAGGLDLTGVSGTLNFAIGETTKTVRIEMSEVQGVEGLEHFRFNLSAPVNATLGQASAMVSIVDNDTVAVLPGLFVRDTVVDEKAGTATFVVMMGGPAGQASGSTVTVGYAVGGGNATAGLDYTGASDPLTGTLTFAPGETVKTVTVSITDDALAEGQERFNLTLSSPVNATIVDGLGVAVIGASSETGIVGPSISVADRVVGEGDGYIDMVVSLSAPSTQAVAVNYITANGTAAGGLDLTGVSGTLNFAIGETTKTVRIEMSEVQGVEGLEHFRFNLSAPVNATLGQASAMVSIVDNDTVAVLPGLFVRDTVVDEKAGTATFVVMMGGPAGQASGSIVTVGYTVGGGNATAGLDYTGASDPLTGTLTFAPGETVKTVTVSITDDALAEGQERANLTLSNAVNGAIIDGHGVAVIGASSETGIVGPSISVADKLVSEGDGYIDMVVALSAPSTQAVAVNYITANGTAVGGLDVTGVSGTLNFAIGETTKTVRIELRDDAVAEPLESFQFNLSAAVNASVATPAATISIVDNDTAGINVYSFGISDDVYTVVASTDVIVENLSGGDDLVLASATYTLGANVENLTLTGVAAINGTGNSLDNVIEGNVANNVLAGGAGVDTVSYAGATAGVTVTLGSVLQQNTVGAGLDTLSGFENLTGSAFNDTLTGDALNNVISGLAGNDVLNGGAGIDTVSYAGATAGVTVTLASVLQQNTVGAGLDTLSGFENLTGSAFNDTLTGDAGDNVISGLAGDDTLNGGAGADTLIGGAGNDTYVVDNVTDVVTENVAEGTDLVRSSVTYTLGANIENLTLTGVAAINGTGNSLNNVIEGNVANNVLAGGAGVDTVSYAGATAGVTVTLASVLQQNTVGAGLDTLSGFENLTGSAFNDTLTGDALNNVISGLAGNDVLNGGVGVDTVSYAGATAGVTVTLGSVLQQNTVGAGLDTLTGFENLTGSAFDDTLSGDAGNNVITGLAGVDTVSYAGATGAVTVTLASALQQNTVGAGLDTLSGLENLTGSAFNDTLTGDALNNVISGLAGNDVLNGGAGVDTVSYAGATAGVTVTLGSVLQQNTVGAGLDTLSGFENLTGSALNDTLTGDALNNVISGLAGNDVLNGGVGVDTVSYAGATAGVTVTLGSVLQQNTVGAGLDTLTGFENLTGSAFDDTLSGDAGNNVITGLTGVDTVSYAGATAAVTVTLASPLQQNTVGAGLDTLSGFENLTGSAFNDTLTGDALNNVISGLAGNDVLNGGAGVDTVSYAGATAGVTVTLASVLQQNTVGAGLDTLSGFENLTGSAFNDTLTGDALNNVISGLAGNDVLNGGAGVDTVSYAGATAGVTVTLGSVLQQNTVGAGLDTLTGFENLTGSAFDDTLSGDAGNNVITGLAGVDTVSYAGATAAVTVTLASALQQNTVGAGLDTLSGFENLTGSAFDDTLTGDALNNVISGLAGNDVLNGGAGVDTVSYAGATAGVTVTLASVLQQNTVGAGLDTLSGFENLTGSAFNDTLTGDALNNVISGLAGNDVLNGGAGVDTVSYAGATAGVTVTLASALQQNTVGAGLDTLTGFENLTGSAFDDTLSGDAGNNVITGLAGNDTLAGGTGADTLTGGTGADRFVFDSLIGSDSVTDFVSGTDKFVFSQAGIHIGNGDTVVDAAATITGPGGFAATSELVIVTGNIAGAINTNNAAAAIGSASGAYGVGDTRLFVVDNGTATDLFLFTSSGTDAAVSAAELTLVGVATSTPATAPGDFLFVA